MPLDQQHIYLLAFWITYCVLHSFLADPRWKVFMETVLGKYFDKYRLGYSVFAAITLVPLIIYHFSISSPKLFGLPVIGLVPFVVTGGVGMFFMAVSIKKYFFYLSGVDVLFEKKAPVFLQTDGLHRYVRHPLYFGTLLLLWSIFFLFPLLSHLIACAVITIYTFVGIRLEEEKLLTEFGDAYRRYATRVPMIFPDLFAFLQRKP